MPTDGRKKKSRFGYKPGERPLKDYPAYRLVELLGDGTFGEVWKVSVPGGGSQAMKIVGLTGDDYIEQEALNLERKALERVRDISERHANLLPINGVFAEYADGHVEDYAPDSSESSDSSWAVRGATMAPKRTRTRTKRPVRLFIIMPFCEGGSLYDRLEECNASNGGKGMPDVVELLGYILDAAAGIDFLNGPHVLEEGRPAEDFVHCDIKPHNLLLLSRPVAADQGRPAPPDTGRRPGSHSRHSSHIVHGRARVSDYSLVRRAASDNRRTSMGAPRTPEYSAPEQESGKPVKASDQFCLAMTYVELRTGRLPYPKGTTWEDWEQFKRNKGLDFSELNPAVQRVLQRATDLAPSKRFASCTEMADALCEAELQPKPRPWKAAVFALVLVACLTTGLLSPTILNGIREIPRTVINWLRGKGPWYDYLKQEDYDNAFEFALVWDRPKNTTELVEETLHLWDNAIKEKVPDSELMAGGKPCFPKAIKLLSSRPPRDSDDEKHQSAADRYLRSSFDPAMKEISRELDNKWATFLEQADPFRENGPVQQLQEAEKVASPELSQKLADWRTRLKKATKDFFDNLKDIEPQQIRRLEETNFFTSEEMRNIITSCLLRSGVRGAQTVIQEKGLDWQGKAKDVQKLAKEFCNKITTRFNELPANPTSGIAAAVELSVDCKSYLDTFQGGGSDESCRSVETIAARVKLYRMQPNDAIALLKIIEIDHPSAQESLLAIQLDLASYAVILDKGPLNRVQEDELKRLREMIDKITSNSLPQQRMMPWENNWFDIAIRHRPPTRDPIAELDAALDDKLTTIPNTDQQKQELLEGLKANAAVAEKTIQQPGNDALKRQWTDGLEKRESIRTHLSNSLSSAEANKEKEIKQARDRADTVEAATAKKNWQKLVALFQRTPGQPHEQVDRFNDLLAAAIKALKEVPPGCITAKQNLDEIEQHLAPDLNSVNKARLNYWQKVLILVGAGQNGVQSQVPDAIAYLKDKDHFTDETEHPLVLYNALKAIAPKSEGQTVKDIMALVWSIRRANPRDDDVRKCLNVIFPEWTKCLIREAAFSTDLVDFDTKKAEAGELLPNQNALCDAWRAECQLTQTPQFLPREPNSNGSAYVAYVRALHEIKRQANERNPRLQWNLNPVQWAELLKDLETVFKRIGEDERALVDKTRLEPARMWVKTALSELYKLQNIDTGRVPIRFYADYPNVAAEVCNVLDAYKLPGRDNSFQQPDTDLPKDFRVPYALATLYKPKPHDFALSEKVLNSSLKPGELQAGVQSLLFSYLQKRFSEGLSGKKEDRIRIVKYSGAFLKTREKGTEAGEAKTIAHDVLDDALLTAHDLEADCTRDSDLKSSIVELYYSAYRFGEGGIELEKFSEKLKKESLVGSVGGNWRSHLRDALIRLLDGDPPSASLSQDNAAVSPFAGNNPARRKAVDPRLASLLLDKAREDLVGDSHRPADAKEAIKDAERAKNLPGNDEETVNAALILLEKAHYHEASDARSCKIRLLELRELINNCSELGKRLEGIAAPNPEQTKALMKTYLTHNEALVLRANFEQFVPVGSLPNKEFNDPKEDLREAVQLGEGARRLRDVNTFTVRSDDPLDYPDLALGNAYEDLAWVCDVEPAKNYELAIKAFTAAAERTDGTNLSKAVANHSIGRCFYRIAAQEWCMDKEFLNQAMIVVASRKEARSNAEVYFNAANGFLDDAEAFKFLGAMAADDKDKGDGECDSYFQRAMTASPTDASATLIKWAGLQITRKRYAEAESTLKKVVPREAPIRVLLAGQVARLHLEQGKTYYSKAAVDKADAQFESMKSTLDNAIMEAEKETSQEDPTPDEALACLYRLRGECRRLKADSVFQELTQNAAHAQVTEQAWDVVKKGYDDAAKDFDLASRRACSKFQLILGHGNAALARTRAYAIARTYMPLTEGPAKAGQQYVRPAIEALKKADSVMKRVGNKEIEWYIRVVAMVNDHNAMHNNPRWKVPLQIEPADLKQVEIWKSVLDSKP